MMGFLAKSGALFLSASIFLFSFDTYQIKYEPVTRKCEFFVNLQYIAHIDLNSSATNCFFYLQKKYKKCEKIQSKNILKSEVSDNYIFLEIDKINKVSFNGYFCQ